ncbi:MAG: hypothetical protein HUU21_12270 [Polyangiaceae bacterium]|nr:hypothetical protein [Polyangiaceae bacterium]NUQ74324.1 hypothetical protein [Polyangiaceae bacterium]
MNPGPRRGFLYDFAVYDGQGRLSALVEAKRRFGTSPSWARKWRAAILEDMARPPNTTTLLVAPDCIYVWRPGADASANPDWTLDARAVLAPYFARLKIAPTEVDPQVFEAIVGLWLWDVVQGDLLERIDVGSVRELFDALRGGEVEEQVAA